MCAAPNVEKGGFTVIKLSPVCVYLCLLDGLHLPTYASHTYHLGPFPPLPISLPLRFESSCFYPSVWITLLLNILNHLWRLTFVTNFTRFVPSLPKWFAPLPQMSSCYHQRYSASLHWWQHIAMSDSSTRDLLKQKNFALFYLLIRLHSHYQKNLDSFRQKSKLRTSWKRRNCQNQQADSQ